MKGTREGEVSKGRESKTQSNRDTKSRTEKKRIEDPIQGHTVDPEMIFTTQGNHHSESHSVETYHVPGTVLHILLQIYPLWNFMR